MAVIEATQDTSDNSTNAAIIPSQGFSFNSLWRGVLGMVTLIFIAFLFKLRSPSTSSEVMRLPEASLEFMKILRLPETSLEHPETRLELP